MLKKITKLVILVFATIVTSSPLGSFSYAQSDCTICNGPHQTLENYRLFVLDILNEVETYATYGTKAGANGTPGVFQDGSLPTNQSNVLKKGLTQLAKNINQTIQTNVAIVGILGNNIWSGLVGDLLPGLGLVRVNATLQRDMDMLLEIDELITEKRLQLGLGGGLLQNVDVDHVKKFQAIKDNYQGILLYDDQGGGLWIGTTDTYGNILSLLQQAQTRMKWFVTYGGPGKFLDKEGKPDLITFNHTALQFEPKAIIDMAEAYHCSRGTVNQCDSNMQSFGKAIGEKAAEGGKKIWTSLKRFGTSAKKLGAAFRNAQILTSDTSVLEKECEFGGADGKGDIAACQALMAMGEAGTSRHGLTFNNNAKRIRGKISGGQELGISTLTESVKESVQDIKKYTSQYAYFLSKKGDNQLEPTTTNPFSQDLQEELNAALEETLHSYIEIQQHAILSNPRDITQQIPILCANIQTALNTIGDKEATQTIIQNLGIACEKQCANAGGTCRY